MTCTLFLTVACALAAPDFPRVAAEAFLAIARAD